LEFIANLSWKIGYFLPIGRYIEAVSKKGFTEVKVCLETAFRLVDENRIDEALLKFANLLDVKGETIVIPSAILVFMLSQGFLLLTDTVGSHFIMKVLRVSM
jgi:hypothetical protein